MPIPLTLGKTPEERYREQYPKTVACRRCDAKQIVDHADLFEQGGEGAPGIWLRWTAFECFYCGRAQRESRDMTQRTGYPCYIVWWFKNRKRRRDAEATMAHLERTPGGSGSC